MAGNIKKNHRQGESVYSARDPKRREYVEQDSIAGPKDPLTRNVIIYRLAIFLLILIVGGLMIANQVAKRKRERESAAEQLREDERVSQVAAEQDVSFRNIAVPRSDFLLHDFADFSPAEIPADGEITLDVNWLQQTAWHISQGQKLYRWKEWSDALREYEKAERIMPDLHGLHEQMGLCCFWTEDYERAGREFEQALELDEDTPGLLNNLGLAHIFMEDYEEAEQYLSRAIQLDDKYSPAYFNLGLTRFRQGDMNAAANSLRDFLALEPGNEDAVHLFSQALMKAGRWNEAIIVLESSLMMMPKAVPLHFRLAEALLEKKQYDKAMDTIDRAIDLVDAKSGLTWLSQGGYDPLRQRADFQELVMRLNQAL